MVDKQTRKSTPPRFKLAILVLLVGILVSAGINISITNTTAFAVAGCPGLESPGTGANDGKCLDQNGQPTGNTPTTSQNGAPSANPTTAGDEETTCAIEKVGWILCPIIEASGKVGDQAFGFLAKTFLETEPELISSTPGVGTRMAWEMARNLANIMFIIAFLIIIYSQVTGAGISNYGIKRMLPRLIFAALAVNVSYFICQAMVDITNILGYELQRFLVDAAKSITQNTAMPMSSGQSFQSGGTLTNIALGVLAFGAVVYFLLPVLGAVIGLVLITCLSIVVILLLRKAFIVLLIVVSPIAFVLYLLPNTEKYFQKWLTMFWKLLLVFPVVGLLMGAGQLASSVVLAAGVSSNTVYSDPGSKCINLPTHTGSAGAATGNCTPGSVPFLLGLTAAGIAVIPLLAVYSVLQGALSAAGAIGGKIGGSISNWNSGRRSNLSKARAENAEYRKNRRDALALQGGRFSPMNIATLGSARRGAMRRQKQRIAKDELNRSEIDYAAGKMVDDNGELTTSGRLAAGLFSNEDTQKRVAASAINAKRKLQEDANAAAHNIVDRLDPNDAQTHKQAQDLIMKGDFDSPHLAALLEHIGKSDQQAFMRLATLLSSKSGGVGSNATHSAANIMSGMGYYGGGDVAKMRNGMAMDATQTAISNIQGGGLSATDLAKLSNDGTKTLEAFAAADASGKVAQGINEAYKRMTNEQLNNMSSEKIGRLNGITGQSK